MLSQRSRDTAKPLVFTGFYKFRQISPSLFVLFPLFFFRLFCKLTKLPIIGNFYSKTSCKIYQLLVKSKHGKQIQKNEDKKGQKNERTERKGIYH